VPGGTDYYEVSCGDDGAFTAGTPTSGDCEAPGFSISGVVVDAQNGNTKLGDATLSFVGGGLTHTVTSEANGHYHLFLPEADYTVTATKTATSSGRRALPSLVRFNKVRVQTLPCLHSWRQVHTASC